MTTKDELVAENARLARRIKFLEKAIAAESREIEQLVSDVFPAEFPLYPDSWGESYPTRCVGEHTPITLVMRALREVEDLREQAQSLRNVYYRPIYDKDGRIVTAFWYDRLTWKEPADTFGKRLFVQEL